MKKLNILGLQRSIFSLQIEDKDYGYRQPYLSFDQFLLFTMAADPYTSSKTVTMLAKNSATNQDKGNCTTSNQDKEKYKEIDKRGNENTQERDEQPLPNFGNNAYDLVEGELPSCIYAGGGINNCSN
ncbi:hypothetical protein PVK06_016074 [Gossypium arboreum]|uniref:Uncharacterized protein n=1 Tax=Gossypium arboreum TaxID=29729 RepID=A0ABR0PZ31_GOSAR|nr:hypothetical protein PVK06_016074 [Gossypium arboreum]